MPTEAEIDQLFARVAELEAWRKVQQGEVHKEVPKEPEQPKAAAAKVEPPKAAPFPPVPPKPAAKDDEDDNGKTSHKK